MGVCVCLYKAEMLQAASSKLTNFVRGHEMTQRGISEGRDGDDAVVSLRV